MASATLGFAGGPTIVFRIDLTSIVGKFTSMTDCDFEGCTQPVRTRKWCGTHYERWRKYGDPAIVLKSGSRPGRVGELSFHWKGDQAGVDAQHKRITRERGTPQQCSPCGTDDPSKYYHWAFNNTGDRNNVWDYIRMCAGCHRKYDIEFSPRGSRHGNSKLTEEDIPVIFARRKRGELLREIASSYGISIGTLSAVLDRKTWKHVSGRW